jgi:hypothetical protein
MKFYVHYKATADAPANLSRFDGARAGFVMAKDEDSAQVKADRWAAEATHPDSFTRNGFVVTVKAA